MRHENADLKKLNINESRQKYSEFYGFDGKQLPEGAKPKHVCAKKIINQDTNKISYYILCNSEGNPYNPNGDQRYNKRANWKFKLVQANTFDLYKKFLETKYNSLLLQTKRNM